jgi:hypothetical protein
LVAAVSKVFKSSRKSTPLPIIGAGVVLVALFNEVDDDNVGSNDGDAGNNGAGDTGCCKGSLPIPYDDDDDDDDNIGSDDGGNDAIGR